MPTKGVEMTLRREHQGKGAKVGYTLWLSLTRPFLKFLPKVSI